MKGKTSTRVLGDRNPDSSSLSTGHETLGHLATLPESWFTTLKVESLAGTYELKNNLLSYAVCSYTSSHSLPSISVMCLAAAQCP
jgi:hypothetical protein